MSTSHLHLVKDPGHPCSTWCLCPHCIWDPDKGQCNQMCTWWMPSIEPALWARAGWRHVRQWSRHPWSSRCSFTSHCSGKSSLWVCSQGKMLEADADSLGAQCSKNSLVVSISPKLKCCLLLGGTTEKDSFKENKSVWGVFPTSSFWTREEHHDRNHKDTCLPLREVMKTQSSGGFSASSGQDESKANWVLGKQVGGWQCLLPLVFLLRGATAGMNYEKLPTVDIC